MSATPRLRRVEPARPPQSVHAEQAVLGALLLDASAWHQVAETIGEPDFSRPDHRLIFKAISALAAAGKPCDPVTVSEELDRTGNLDGAGGVPYLSSLARETPTSANARAYANTVREKANLRRLEEASDDIRLALVDGASSAQIVESIGRTVETIRGQQAPAPDPMETVRASIRADLEAGPGAVDAAMPPRFVSRPVLPVAGANLAGSGSSGKTTNTLCEMVHVCCGGQLYGNPVEMQGTCVLITAEDGADYARYVLQQVLQDGVESGLLPERAVARAKANIRIIGYPRASYGPIVQVDELGAMRRAPVWDVMLESLAPLSPVYVTLDPAVLFGPGERYGNDGDAYLAAMIHESALALGACIQLIDHVAQAVARGGIIDQYAARGGTAKTDNARLARQLVRITPAAAADLVLPPTVTAEQIAAGRILQLHTTKSNYAPLPPPAWLRRRRFWIEHLRAPSADEAAARESQDRARQKITDTEVLVEYVRQQLAVGGGIRLTQRDLEAARPARPDGTQIPRDRVRDAVRYAIATGLLRHAELPPEERIGQKRTYLAPAPGSTL